MFERFPDDWWAEKVIDLYYKQLNDDAHFQVAFAELCQTLAEPARRLVELGKLTRNHNQFCQPYPFQPSNIREVPSAAQWRQSDDFAYWCLYDEIGQALSAFCDHWHLPIEYGLRDVWDCLWLYSFMPHREPELYAVMRERWIPVVGSPAVIDVVESGSDRIPVIMNLPYIFPNVPLPFMYDPVEQSRAWLNRQIDMICDNVRQSILNQAEALESQAKAEGWDKRPPRYTDAYLQRVARALYLRAVKGMRWEDVMSQCDDALSDQEGFADRIRDWARRCGIPL